MDPARAARIQEWDASPISGGYRGLTELADANFSGAVTTGSAWLFMLNGRVVGVVDGTLSSFESADATAHKAPDPTLPLLFAMQERGGEIQAKYYTDDSPLPEVHETLSEANFTGYIELSDNVLSGDYYVVYYGGKSMSAAFVGNAERLVTGEEAFHRAADEVGIYEVIDVDLDVREVPEPASDQPAAEPADADPPVSEPDGEPEPEPAAEAGETTDVGTGAEPAASPEAGTASPDESAAASTADIGQSTDRPDRGTGQPSQEQPDRGRAGDDPISEEEAWREARTIPALDPDETDAPAAAEDGGQQSAPAEPVAPEPSPEGEVDDERLAELEEAIESQSETIAELESKLESTSEEAEQLREERAQLESQLESAQASTGDQPAARPGTALDPDDALEQTDLFVRYNSKGRPTLETAHGGEADREAVVKNLRIDHHTRFDEDEVSIEGRSFEPFLTNSLEYRFVNWLVTEFLFEIRDTGSQRGLRDVYDVIPRIDRAEFRGTVTWRDQDEGETYSEDFDVICRDRMGKALVVANLNDVRDPATGEMMDALVEGASTVSDGIESLGGAFMVTSSFFRPDALETASEATGGGLRLREKRWSYVKVRRGHGYHLCLVEARGDAFHVAVPEM